MIKDYEYNKREEKLTILHLLYKYSIGGAESVVKNICNNTNNKYQHIICSFFEPEINNSNYQFKGKMICLNKKNGNDLISILRLSNIIKKEKVNIVHAIGWATFIEGLIATKLFNYNKCKFIYAFHGKTITDLKYGIPNRRILAQRYATKIVDNIIAPSKQMANDYAKTISIDEASIKTIYNGIDLSLYEKNSNTLRNKYSLSTNDFVIGFVGRLDPVKNLIGILISFKKFLNKVSGYIDLDIFKLLIVGDGEERSTISEISKILEVENKIIFVGMSDQVPEHLSIMNIYLQPSLYEGHSITIIEAMAAGLPVISTNVGGTPEIIKDGHSGLLFEPFDFEGISSGILLLYRSKLRREKIAFNGKKYISQKFSINKMIREYEELFQSYEKFF